MSLEEHKLIYVSHLNKRLNELTEAEAKETLVMMLKENNSLREQLSERTQSVLEWMKTARKLVIKEGTDGI